MLCDIKMPIDEKLRLRGKLPEEIMCDKGIRIVKEHDIRSELPHQTPQFPSIAQRERLGSDEKLLPAADDLDGIDTIHRIPGMRAVIEADQLLLRDSPKRKNQIARRLLDPPDKRHIIF